MTSRRERPRDVSALTHRRLVPRYRWPEASERLRAAKTPFTAEAVHEQRAVLVRCTAKGAAKLDGLATTAPAGIGSTARSKPSAPPEPSREWRETDPLEQAFARAQREAKARAEAAA